MEPTVIYESNEGICSLTLNRPDVFNALNLQLVKDLISALRKAESEPDVRVVILKGGPGRIAGADRGERG
ncbi:MAG: enoyl-CoA hydratase/isomerase family protein [Deltaproteobacteria bacterium]|nr:enoyl-CoA hydratase/isomerase family protein [Deltaproteobacteria bacterium]